MSNFYRKAKDDYEKTLLKLWLKKEWIDGTDFYQATGGSQKFTSRISDMRKKGYIIEDRWVHNKNGGKHKVYKLVKMPEEAA